MAALKTPACRAGFPLDTIDKMKAVMAAVAALSFG
jgi:hypothetical protein